MADPVAGAAGGAAAGSAIPGLGTVAGGVLGFLGSLLSSGSAAGLTREQLAQLVRQFNIQNQQQYELGSRSQQLSEGQVAGGMGQQLANLPLRDRISYNLMSRMSQSPQQFVARDMFNPQNGPPQAGGIDFGKLSQANNAYTPGAGGQGNGSLQRAILKQIGYAPDAQGTYHWQQPGGPVGQTVGQYDANAAANAPPPGSIPTNPFGNGPAGYTPGINGGGKSYSGPGSALYSMWRTQQNNKQRPQRFNGPQANGGLGG